jgi:hypothetical protein
MIDWGCYLIASQVIPNQPSIMPSGVAYVPNDEAPSMRSWVYSLGIGCSRGHMLLAVRDDSL